MAGDGDLCTGFLSLQGNERRYYHTDTLITGQEWEWCHLLTIHGTRIAFDYPDRGRGNGRPGGSMPWGSGHRHGTRDFRAGDAVGIVWTGGRRGDLPKNAVVELRGGTPGLTDVTEAMLEQVRVVPNPYLVHQEAERGEPRLYFNYLPEECTIRIYTLALDLVRTITHRGGSREEWNLQTEGGQLVASQLLIAQIEAPNGTSITRKFVVVMGQ